MILSVFSARLVRSLAVALVTTCVFAVVGVGRVCAQEVSAAEKADGFVSLFNGKDFTGWQFDGGVSPPDKLPENWKVEDGVIKLSGGGKPHIGSDKAYADFEMRFEWRSTKANYNSGFYVRSGRKVGANQINLAKGSEGMFVGKAPAGAKKVPELQKPAGEWNEWRVLVEGEKIRFWCNGQVAWEADGFQPAQGHVGFQAEGAPLEFRNLRIREIKAK